ncbi:MAG: hypothetical protein ACQES5_07420 [Thermodesulfobacteriota bacterium]
MDNLHYVGLDVHKKTIAFCNKLADGKTTFIRSLCSLLTATNVGSRAATVLAPGKKRSM